jgi:hypothetical protein
MGNFACLMRRSVARRSRSSSSRLGHAQQITGIVEVLGGALPGHAIVLAQHSWQAQRLQVMVEQ